MLQSYLPFFVHTPQKVIAKTAHRGQKKSRRNRRDLNDVFKKANLINTSNIHGIFTFLAVFYFEFHAVVLLDLVDQTGCVYESFAVSSFVLDEAKTFCFVEELYSSLKFLFHLKEIIMETKIRYEVEQNK